MTVRSSIFDYLDNSPAPSATSWAHQAPALTEAEAHAVLREQAKKTAASIIATRAHRYAVHPRELDALESNQWRMQLSLLARYPKTLRRRIAELIDEEVTTPRRCGGEVVMLNLRAAMIYAEQLCAIEARKEKEP